MTPREKARTWHKGGIRSGRIALALGVSARTVQRWVYGHKAVWPLTVTRVRANGRARVVRCLSTSA
jgi:uncharacterized protein YjcR